MRQPRPLKELDAAACRRLAGILTDIDDTLTTEGALTAGAYDALCRASAAGLAVVPVTGRPAGWADHIARMWPVAGVVAENGGLYLRYADRRMIKRTVHGQASPPPEYRRRLDALAADVLARVPGTALASDQPYRELDVAIDYREDVEALGPEAVNQILAVCTEHGATAKVSSIHVNAWFGQYDKLGMVQHFLREALDYDLADPAIRERFLFVGDSPNDQPMFEFFPNSVGVANIENFAERITHWPTWVTASAAGAGFTELVDHILEARSS